MNYLDKTGVEEIIKQIKQYAASKSVKPSQEEILKFFPVGTCVLSADKNWNPNETIGGTWERWQNYSVTTYYDTDNSKWTHTWYDSSLEGQESDWFLRTVESDQNTDSHYALNDVLTTNGLPAHTHVTEKVGWIVNDGKSAKYESGNTAGRKYTNDGKNYGHRTTSAGGGGDRVHFHHTPLYFAVIVWDRKE